MEFDEKDVTFSYYNPDDRRNGWMLDPNIGVCIKHTPTGLEERCATHPAKKENEISAMYALRVKVQAIHTAPAKVLDLKQIEADFNSGVVVSRTTFGKLIKRAIELETAAKKHR